jgi:hypothetical protein
MIEVLVPSGLSLDVLNITRCNAIEFLSQWQRRLSRRSAAARLLRLWVRIPPWPCMSVVSVVCCQVDYLCVGLISCPE